MLPKNVLPALPRLPGFRSSDPPGVMPQPAPRPPRTLDEEFREKMETEGFDSDLVSMGLAMADNHSRTREDALRIGENYIRQMSK